LAFQHEGRPVPPNPVGDMSALSMLRNMTTYVSLLGALVAIVLGWQTVSEDRRSGVFPLIVSRPMHRGSYATGKVLALLLAIAGLLGSAGVVNALSLLLLPGTPLTSGDWVALVNFYAVSVLFLAAFGLLAMASAAWHQSEAMGLLVPVTVWLVLSFVFPQLGANINPMAAMNPIKAMVAPPTGAFFELVGPLLAPVSLVSTYRDIAATMLGFAPADTNSLGLAGGITSLAVADLLMGGLAVLAITMLDATRSGTDE
jgi:ABC-type transport system involved in multi-copper enzyme maturation permease subunit